MNSPLAPEIDPNAPLSPSVAAEITFPMGGMSTQMGLRKRCWARRSGAPGRRANRRRGATGPLSATRTLSNSIL